MAKLKAALIHITISIFLLGILYYIIAVIWYPKPFFSIASVIQPMKLLVMVDVIIGPMLTFIVYKKGKKSLMFDLTVIAILQISALAYGIYTIEQGRPAIIVYKNEKLHYVNTKFSKNKQVKDPNIHLKLFARPQMGTLPNTGNLDIYSDYEDIKAVKDFKLEWLPHSLTTENMKAQFKSKADEIEALNNKYKDDKIVFFLLKNQMASYYVVFSTTQNKIIDKLHF